MHRCATESPVHFYLPSTCIFSMLQVMNAGQAHTIVFKKIIEQQNSLPQFLRERPTALLCKRCLYVNETSNHFCTNCGYPVTESESDYKLFRLRSRQRADLLRQASSHIMRARIMLYVASIFFLASVGFVFSNNDNKYALTLGGFVLSALFFLLAKWSKLKPFTAMLTSFIVVLTFCTITIFGEFVTSFSTVQGLYSIVTGMIMIYFLLRAVQSAYKFDLLKEEMEVH